MAKKQRNARGRHRRPQKPYTLQEALNHVRQGQDIRSVAPLRQPLYMLLDVCMNLDVRYPHNVLKHLSPKTVGVIKVAVRQDAARRGEVTGTGVTLEAVEVMVARANRRPAFMRRVAGRKRT